jgi:hypothetical protein
VSQPRPIVFLHIPKTAGQSIREFLSAAFPQRLLFPGQLDSHLALYSRSELEKYSIFSGHFSWSLFEFLGNDALYFTILREPSARIVSLYRFLRRQAKAMEPAYLNLPNNIAIKAALDLSFDEYIKGENVLTKNFIKSQFDNYYIYYFGTRLQNGRSLIRDNYKEDDYFVTERVLQNAINNIQDSVKIYGLSNLSQIHADLSSEEGYKYCEIPHVNVAPQEDAESFNDILARISSSLESAIEQIHINCQHDYKLFRFFCT